MEKGSFLNNTFPYGCKNFSYCDSHRKYIATGDLSFIFNYKLQNLFSEGLIIGKVKRLIVKNDKIL